MLACEHYSGAGLRDYHLYEDLFTVILMVNAFNYVMSNVVLYIAYRNFMSVYIGEKHL